MPVLLTLFPPLNFRTPSPFSFSASVPALLESETIAGLSGSAVKLVVSRKRAGSDPRPLGTDAPTMASVLRQLRALHTALSRQALPQSLAEQAFRQMTYLICASALNNLLLRKDMCCWSRGMQIRYTVANKRPTLGFLIHLVTLMSLIM